MNKAIGGIQKEYAIYNIKTGERLEFLGSRAEVLSQMERITDQYAGDDFMVLDIEVENEGNFEMNPYIFDLND